MNSKLFIEYLPWIRRPSYYFESKNGIDGWDDAEIAKAIAWQAKDTTPLKRSKALEISDAPADLQNLYIENDLGSVSFLAGISFWSDPKKLAQGWGFADMSEVNIVVAPSGQIEAYNAHPIRGMPGATDCLGVLAKDLQSFLGALLCAQFNQSHFLYGFPDEDPILFQKTVLVAKHCTLIAGGDEYYDFWAGILRLPPTDTMPQ